MVQSLWKTIWRLFKKLKVVVVGGLVAKPCLTLATPWTILVHGSSVHGILQAKILEWVVISFSRDHPDPEIDPGSPAMQADS